MAGAFACGRGVVGLIDIGNEALPCSTVFGGFEPLEPRGLRIAFIPGDIISVREVTFPADPSLEEVDANVV